MLSLFCAAILLSSCAALPGSAAPVVKIGVVAPFEGAGRELGYAVLPAIKSIVAEANGRRAFGPYRVAVVAFNDNLDSMTAAEQAEALALDPAVMAVVGPLSQSTADAASSVLTRARLASFPILSANPSQDDYAPAIAAAEAATRRAVDALAADIAARGRPTRPGILRQLVAQP